MATWKRLLTEADLTTGDILSGITGGNGVQATDNNDGTFTIEIVDTSANGSGIDIGANSIAILLDGNSLVTGSNGLKINDNGVSDEHLDVTAITGHTNIGGSTDNADQLLIFDSSASELKRVTAQNFASYVSTAGGGDYDLDLQDITSGEISELQFELDGTVEKRIRFINQDNETTITTGGGTANGNPFESVTIGLDDNVEIQNTLVVNESQSATGTVFHVKDDSSSGFQSTSQFDGNVVINGNLTVAGDTTTTVVDTLNVEDSTFVINSDAPVGGGTISNGGMVLKTNGGNANGIAKVEWRSNNNLSGWHVTNQLTNSGHTQGFPIMCMEFQHGEPNDGTDLVMGDGSFYYDTQNNDVYVRIG